MEYAISLRDGKDVLAVQADHEASRGRLLVCPECGEPVFFKKRWIPNETPFFSHYQELPTVKLLHKCSLRVEDATFRPASQVIRGISKGQLVDRFQREFCRELHLAFGRNSSRLGNFIRASQHELGKPARDELIRDVERGAPCNTILLRPLEDEDEADFRAGVADVCRFLRSSYGLWVSRFLYQTAYFLALVMHQRTLNDVIGRRLFRVNEQDVILVLDNARLLQSPDELAKKVLATRDQRNVAVFEIAPVLVSFLLLRWRRRGSLLPRLFAKAGPEFRLRHPALADQDSETRPSEKVRTRTPVLSPKIKPVPVAPTVPSDYLPSPSLLPRAFASQPLLQALTQEAGHSRELLRTSRALLGPLGHDTGRRESGHAQHDLVSSNEAPPISNLARADVSLQRAVYPMPREMRDSPSRLTKATHSPGQSTAEPSLPERAPIASPGWADGFVPDGAYVPPSKLGELRQVIRCRWPNGYRPGNSEWHFFPSMGLLVNLRTCQVYSGHQLRWETSYVSVIKGGKVAFGVSLHLIVWALLGAD